MSQVSFATTIWTSTSATSGSRNRFLTKWWVRERNLSALTRQTSISTSRLGCTLCIITQNSLWKSKSKTQKTSRELRSMGSGFFHTMQPVTIWVLIIFHMPIETSRWISATASAIQWLILWRSKLATSTYMPTCLLILARSKRSTSQQSTCLTSLRLFGLVLWDQMRGHTLVLSTSKGETKTMCTFAWLLWTPWLAE